MSLTRIHNSNLTEELSKVHNAIQIDPSAPANSLQIDSNGYMLTPNRPAFRARTNSNVSINVAADQPFPFNTTVHDVGNDFDIVSHRFVVPVDGIYHFDFYSIFLGTVLNGGIYLAINGLGQAGTYVHLSEAGSGNWNAVNWNGDLRLNVGDYIDVRSYNSTVTFHGENWSAFSGHLIG